METSRRRQILHTGVGMAVLQGCTFVASLRVASGLGAAGQARFQALVSCCMLATLLAKLGLDEALAYTVPRVQRDHPERVRGLVAYALGFAAVIGTAVGFAIDGAREFIAGSLFSITALAKDLWLATVLTPVLLVLLIGLGALRGLARSDLRAYAYYYAVGLSFLVLVLVLGGDGLVQGEAYAARILSFALGATLCVAFVFCVVGRGPWTPVAREVRALHSSAGWMLAVGVFQYMVEQPLVDLMILSHHVSDAEVGAYSVAAKFAALPGLIPAVFVIVMAPYFARHAAAGDSDARDRAYSRMSLYIAHLSIIACGLLFFTGDYLLVLIGREYTVAGDWLRALLPGYLLAGLLGINSPVLLASGKARVELVLIASAAIVMAALGLLLTPRLGGIGMAAATATAVGFLALIRRFVCRRIVGARLLWSWPELGVLVIAACLAIAVREWSYSDAAAAVVFLITYGGGAALVRRRAQNGARPTGDGGR